MSVATFLVYFHPSLHTIDSTLAHFRFRHAMRSPTHAPTMSCIMSWHPRLRGRRTSVLGALEYVRKSVTPTKNLIFHAPPPTVLQYYTAQPCRSLVSNRGG
ncbi:hypothetical protein CDAR_51341 [Caerostris darwini]|uniref:Uncharacterized protein n=1 Tax=Caerostris darwini TaxID=1538125 RepID=A0AAV4U647_9ARAC|nr:hypothetical protein CDAR_51341 [Caerostris darwini]